MERFIEQWERVKPVVELRGAAQDGGKLLKSSYGVLLTHEDKTYAGAFIASASIPWGQSKGDSDLGGYHLVWTRDMVQTATCPDGVGADHQRDARADLSGMHAEVGRRVSAELLGDGRAVLDRDATGRDGIPNPAGLPAVEAGCAGEFRCAAVCRAGGGLPGAACTDNAARPLGGERGVFAVDADGGDRWR